MQLNIMKIILCFLFRIPTPTPPPFELLPKVLVDSVVISIVAYTVSYSMSKIFAKRHSYQVDATQELYALVRPPPSEVIKLLWIIC